MRIIARTINNKVLQLSLSLAAYLNGPVSSVVDEDVNPFYILESYLPINYTVYQDSELLLELERACLLAVRSQENELAYVHPLRIKVEHKDLDDFKLLYYRVHAHSPTTA